MPRRGLRKKIKQYVLDRFQEDAPEAYFKFKSSNSQGLSRDEAEFVKAIEVSAVQVVMSLLNCGLDPNFTVSPQGETPLHVAVNSTRSHKDPVIEKILGFLLYFGADPNSVTLDGESPLHLACGCDNFSVVEKLVDAGADVNLVTDLQESVVMRLCGSPGQDGGQILDFLLASGADVTGVNSLDQTALHYVTQCASCSLQRSKVVDCLLRQGLSVTHPDHKGCCPVTYELGLLSGGHPSLGEESLAVLRSLLKGGGSIPFLDVLHFKQTAMVRGTPGRYQLLHQLITDVHHVVPRHQLRELLDQLSQRPHAGLPKVKAICQDLEEYLAKVPTLAQSCCAVVRATLGGRVAWSVQQLPLPPRMREFVWSID